MNSVLILVPAGSTIEDQTEEVQADIKDTGSIALSETGEPVGCREYLGKELRIYRTEASLTEINALITARSVPWTVMAHRGDVVPATEETEAYTESEKPISFAEIEPWLADVLVEEVYVRPTELKGFHKESGQPDWVLVA